MAKQMPTRSVIVPPKFTSQGVPLEVVEREQQELAEKKRYMERTIRNMVENAFLDNGMFPTLIMIRDNYSVTFFHDILEYD